MRRTLAPLVGLSLCALVAAACGGSCPEPREPEAVTAVAPPPEPPASDESADGADESSSTDDAPPAEGSGGQAPATVVAEPTFPEGATVAQAMAAVPQGSDRANIEPEVLGEPLQDGSLYEPCKVGTQHFKLRVAVWGGRAVGVDVVTSNKKLAECVATQVRKVEWRDKVRSLNTIDYSM
jgi:hypothetical protein